MSMYVCVNVCVFVCVFCDCLRTLFPLIPKFTPVNFCLLVASCCHIKQFEAKRGSVCFFFNYHKQKVIKVICLLINIFY